MHSLRLALALALVLACAPAHAKGASPEKAFLKAAKQRNNAGMVTAAEAIADKPTKKGLKVLVSVGAMIPSIDVYTACREAIAKSVKDAALRAEIGTLLKKSKRIEQRSLCVDGLGDSGDPGAIALLNAALTDKEKSVRVAAIQGLTRLMLKGSVEPLFERLAKVGFESKDAEAEELYGALFKLTKQAYEKHEDWKNWWATASGDFDPKKRATTGGESGTRLRTNNKGEGKIFESVVRSQAFVLVLDISSSMRVIDLPPGQTWKSPSGKQVKFKDPDPKGRKAPHKFSRFTRAKEAFVKFIEGMSQRARFAIVVFGEKKDTRLWKKEVVKANPKNKKAAVAFVKGLKWSGATRTDLALEQAFAVKGADTIYLFSDGIPEKVKGGKSVDIPQDAVVETARTLNRARKLRLNCYGMTSSNKTRAFLEKLAKENGGEYKDIRAPAKK
jgi:hypothetical protein